MLRFLFICTMFMIEHDVNMDKQRHFIFCIDDFSTIWKSNLDAALLIDLFLVFVLESVP